MLPTLYEHASEKLNSLPRSSLIYLHYRLSTAVGGNHHGTEERQFESKYKTKSEDSVFLQDQNGLWINWTENQFLGFILTFIRLFESETLFSLSMFHWLIYLGRLWNFRRKWCFFKIVWTLCSVCLRNEWLYILSDGHRKFYIGK